MDTQELIRILKEVPETRLRLIDLTWKVVGEDGAIDANKVALHYKEIAAAVKEAEGYSGQTKGAVQCLKELVRFSP